MLSYAGKAFLGNVVCETMYRYVIVLIVMHRSAVQVASAVALHGQKNNRMSVDKSSTLKLWLAAPDG